MEKKEYIAPEMECIKIKAEGYLLTTSLNNSREVDDGNVDGNFWG